MERTSGSAICPLCIQFCSYAHSVWVDLGNAIESSVDLIDSRNVCLNTVNRHYTSQWQIQRHTLTRSTLVNSLASSPVSSSSRVTSINAGKPPNAEKRSLGISNVFIRGDETPYMLNWDKSARRLQSKTNSRVKR